ncbi:MAG: hypothetical protein ACYTGH_07365 [Planctomycetota bacterium]
MEENTELDLAVQEMDIRSRSHGKPLRVSKWSLYLIVLLLVAAFLAVLAAYSAVPPLVLPTNKGKTSFIGKALPLQGNLPPGYALEEPSVQRAVLSKGADRRIYLSLRQVLTYPQPKQGRKGWLAPLHFARDVKGRFEGEIEDPRILKAGAREGAYCRILGKGSTYAAYGLVQGRLVIEVIIEDESGQLSTEEEVSLHPFISSLRHRPRPQRRTARKAMASPTSVAKTPSSP